MQRQGNDAGVRTLLEEGVRLCPDIDEYRLWLADSYSQSFEFQGVAEPLMDAVARVKHNSILNVPNQ